MASFSSFLGLLKSILTKSGTNFSSPNCLGLVTFFILKLPSSLVGSSPLVSTVALAFSTVSNTFSFICFSFLYLALRPPLHHT